MSHRRSKLDMSLNILSIVRDGEDKPTRIMYAANMSWGSIQKMLSQLVEHGLLEKRMNTEHKRSKIRYLITEKGERVVNYFRKAHEILPMDELFAF